MYREVEPLCWTPETNVALCVNDTQTKKKLNKNKIRFLLWDSNLLLKITFDSVMVHLGIHSEDYF